MSPHVASCAAVLGAFRVCRAAWLASDRSAGPERDRLKAVARRATDDLLDTIAAAAGVATAAPPRVSIRDAIPRGVPIPHARGPWPDATSIPQQEGEV